jgi:drug/metabolite transporter (DMT)-like permease
MELPDTGTFVVGLVVSTCSAIVVFAHAERHGNRHPTAWGVAAFVFALVGVLVYFGRYLLTQRRLR